MKTQTFLIKADNGREAVMRLPVGARYGGFTKKAYEMIRARFYDGATNTNHRMQYALNLEAYSNATDLICALQSYQANKI